MNFDFGIDLESSRAADRSWAEYWASQPRRPLPANIPRRPESEWRDDIPVTRREDLTPTR